MGIAVHQYCDVSQTHACSVVVLCYLFLVSVSVKFHLKFVQIILSLVQVAEWPPFGKELPTRLTICSLYFD